MELSKVEIAYLEGTYVLEHEQRNGRVKRKFLVALDQLRPMIGRESQGWDLREARVQVLEIITVLCLVFLLFCSAVGQRQSRPY